MDAIYDGRDFHLYLSELGRRKEVTIIPTTQLTTYLTRLDGTDLGKRVDLFFGKAKNPDGIDLSFLSCEDGSPDTFESTLGIRVVMNRRAYDNLLSLGQAASTYGNTENKVRVIRRN